MHKSLKIFALAGAASVFALSATSVAAQDASAPGTTTPDSTMPDTTMSDSTTQTSPQSTPPMDQGSTPPTYPEGDAAATPTTPPVGTETTTDPASSLPADQQAAVNAWPRATQDYYWTLTEERQKLFMALPDSDKVSLSQMPEQQRESTWAQLEARTTPPRS